MNTVTNQTDPVIAANPDLKSYRVTLSEAPGDRFTIVFDCYAEDADHAAEQAENAYPGCEVKNCMIMDSGVLLVSLDGGETYAPAVNGVRLIYSGIELEDGQQGQLQLNMTHEGMIADVYEGDDSIATDSVMYQDIADRLMP